MAGLFVQKDLAPAMMEGVVLERDKEILEDIIQTGDFIYRKMLRIDLERDRGTVLKSDSEGWQPGEGSITGQLARFALDGAVHQEDVERFVTFTRLDQLRRIATGEQKGSSMIYRRKTDGGFRWNLMEVVSDCGEEARFVILCVKDVEDLFREGVEREGLTARDREMIRSLEDRTYIISSLSSLFFSTYYVNLEQDTFRAVNQLSRVGDVLGDEVNYTAALNIYANHFIHEADREEYLHIMSRQNLRETLRWWQPCVAMEYRKLSEKPGSGSNSQSWVRASAVLARAGDDSQPETAVYVAQDISEGRKYR